MGVCRDEIKGGRKSDVLLEEEEGLDALARKVDEAMLGIENLRPSKFTLDDLDGELTSMALIRSLGVEFVTLKSSLLLQDKLDEETIIATFQTHEIDSRTSPSISGGAALATNLLCLSCNEPGHFQRDCANRKATRTWVQAQVPRAI